MGPLTDQQVEQIAGRLVSAIRGYGPVSEPVKRDPVSAETGGGVFSDMNAAISAAATAQRQLMEQTMAVRDRIISAIRTKMLAHAEELAQKAHEETGLGRTEDKILKNRLVTEKTPGTEVLQPGAFSGDRGLTIVETAPYGVIGAITPTTNPTSTIICNTIGMVAAGNAVVFNVHPAASEVSNLNVRLINEAIVSAGGPANLVTSIAKPTIESAQALMQHKGVRLLVVTGGAGVVKAAMTSGKRAICAGPGNPPVVVDESADIELAARSIIRGGSTDNNIICTDEKEVFVVDPVADQLIQAFSGLDAVVLNTDQINRLEKVIFSENRGPRKPGVMNKEFIGKNARVILDKIGLQVEDRIRLAIAPVPPDHPLVWSEQMMPVMPVVRMPDADSAIDIAKEAEHGFNHTAVMHSKNLDNLSRMARVMNCSIFVKNGPSLAGLGFGGEGFTSFSIASPTGEGLTNPQSFSRIRRCTLVDHFRIV